MSSSIKLSYIIPTYNKLPYLKVCLAEMIARIQDDEEIIVVVDGSTDGSTEYLQELLARGDIDQLVVQKNSGHAYATNRAILSAKGELVKAINDDDEYYYDEIQKCKTFMLEHPEIDALGTNGIDQHGEEYHREEDFLKWKKGPYHPFMIAELGLMLRKSSVPIFGLGDTSFLFWEGEFTIRLTAGKAKIAWYTGITWKHTFNPNSISLTKTDVWKKESKRLRRMYPMNYSKWKHLVPKPLRMFARSLFPKKRMIEPESIKNPTFLF